MIIYTKISKKGKRLIQSVYEVIRGIWLKLAKKRAKDWLKIINKL